MHQPDGAAISNPPLRRHHRARPCCEQRRGKALDTLSDDRDATSGPASGKHYQIRLQVEAREICGREKAIFPLRRAILAPTA